jgi:hypothetical protein
MMIRVLCIILIMALMTACSAATIVSISIDALSFIPEEERNIPVIIPQNQGIVIYVLPGIQVDEQGIPPDDIMGAGSLISLPVKDEKGNYDLHFRLNTIIDFSVETIPADFPGGYINIVIADDKSLDIYQDGVIIFQESLPVITAGSVEKISLSCIVGSGDVNYTIISNGKFRTGILIVLDPRTDTSVSMTVSMEALQMDVMIRPFSFIP